MILYCGCIVSANTFQVHSATASTSQAANPKPRVEIPFYNRTNSVQFQDQKYGTGNRVCNLLRSKPGNQQQARCTICDRVRSV